MKSLTRYEIVGILGSIMFAAVILGVSQEVSFLKEKVATERPNIIFAASNTADDENALAEAVIAGSNNRGEIKTLIVQDISFGDGREVRVGDTVHVHYVGIVRNGSEFDNSYVKGEPISFMVGSGEVIEGLERGVIGMHEGGRRLLIIPSSLAYGDNALGPVPSDATLIFSLELVSLQ